MGFEPLINIKAGTKPGFLSEISPNILVKLAPTYNSMANLSKKKQSGSDLPPLIVTDGCKFSLRGLIPNQRKGFRKISNDLNLRYRGYGHQTFENVVEVIYQGNIIGSMEVFPRSLMSPDTVLFSVANRIQYQEGWTKLVQSAWKELNLSFKHTCRIDIATDQPDNDQFGFIKELITGKWRKVGAASFTVEYGGDYNNAGEPNARYFRFGQRSGDKFLRAYYKRQELAHSNKWYIQEWWKKNGIDVDNEQEVARFEMSIKRRELKKYTDVFKQYGDLNAESLHLLERPDYLAALFNTAKSGFFEFVSNRSYMRTGNITRCARKIVLDLSGISCYLLKKVTSKVTNDIYRAKIAAKMLFHICCKTNEPRYMAEIDEILFNFNLRRWFEANRVKFYKEFEYRYNSPNFEFLKKYTSNPEFVQAKIWKRHEFTL